MISFRSIFDPDRSTFEIFPNTRFKFGQESARIEMPASLLSLSLKGGPQCKREAKTPGTLSSPPPGEAVFDFPGSLMMALRTYLGDGHPGIDLAAEIAGTSVRTLQRHLAQLGLNFSELLQQARLESAKELLSDPDTKIVDVALALGYEDASHFSRAFRRIAGVAPREYRRHLAPI